MRACVIEIYFGVASQFLEFVASDSKLFPHDSNSLVIDKYHLQSHDLAHHFLFLFHWKKWSTVV